MTSTSVRPPARRRLSIGAVLAAGSLAAAGLAFAPAAAAVTPTSATVTFNCGLYGGGAATLTTEQVGTSTTATITVTSSLAAPLALAADSISSTLTMTKGTTTTAFTGTKNPAIAYGSPVIVGPLTGTVASGDSLDAGGGSLVMVIFGISVTCTPTSNQAPGPFVYS